MKWDQNVSRAKIFLSLAVYSHRLFKKVGFSAPLRVAQRIKKQSVDYSICQWTGERKINSVLVL